MHPYVHSCGTIHSGQDMKTTEVSTEGKEVSLSHTHTHTHTHAQRNTILSHKKDQTLPSVITQTGLEGMMVSEVSLMGRDKYCLTSLVHGTEQKQKQTHRCGQQIAFYQRGRGGGRTHG